MTIDRPIKAGYSNFGKIPYGYTTMGSLKYDVNNVEADYACRPLNATYSAVNGELDRIPIVMVDRGNCTFVTKTRNAQRTGANIVVIIDNREEEMEDLMMADDGTGSDILIPAVLIKKSDGKIIKDYLSKNQNSGSMSEILVYVDFEMVSSLIKLEYERRS